MRKLSRITSTAATLMVATGLALAIGAGTAQADSYTQYVNGYTGLCLDDSNSYNWRAFPCNYDSWEAGYQKIYHHEFNDGTERLTGQATGLCLRDFGGGRVGHAGCDTSQAESWYHTYDNGLRLKNQATGWCLDDSPEAHLRTFPCNGLSYQAW
ncbi:ricin-type beta-trefoil lectin domain protein [Streptomyces sp. NPDC004232]|uniref:RICIN domain-containing protein n=1 Tax=Streptomyces sp. NPDC004232 TaxID=3154454 RepID=UPI001D5EFEF4|nr:ricin-type beta-trefoil lectin domain protein [Streptomyces sp. tea 10]